MTNVRMFQLYILSKMRAEKNVDAALRDLTSSRNEMHLVAADLSEVNGLDATLHNADAYQAILGHPCSKRSLANSEVSEGFRGSVCFSYQLPLWPGMMFSVNRHPEGYAWGRGFQLHQHIPTLTTAIDVACVSPWQWTIKSLVASSTEATTLYAWDEQCDIEFSFCFPSGQSMSYIGEFDMNMLQSWNHQVDKS